MALLKTFVFIVAVIAAMFVLERFTSVDRQLFVFLAIAIRLLYHTFETHN